MQKEGGSPMLRQLALASLILLTPPLVSAQTAKFPIEEATIEGIQAAILRGELTSTRDTLRVRAFVDEGEISKVCLPQPARITADGVPGKQMDGTVENISAAVVENQFAV